MATLGRLKRGSVQIQRAAIKATGRIGARSIMAALVLWALVLQGLVQHSSTVVLMTFNNHMSEEEFADYVANTSYVTRYCRPGNSSQGDEDVSPTLASIEGHEGSASDDYVGSGYGEDKKKSNNDSLNTSHHRFRNAVEEPYLKVPVSEEDSKDALLREAFLWGCFLSSMPSSYLVTRFGPKRVVGVSVLVSGALVALVPFVWFSPTHIIIRLVQGAFAGATWPSLHVLGTKWYPPLQRTGYVSYYAAVSLGYALSCLLGTPLVQLAGRDWLCYVLTCLSVLWFLAWHPLVHDSPAGHPRVSDEQRLQLLAAIGPSVATDTVPPIPWKCLFTSYPVWACAAANFGNQWGQAALQLALTKYLKLVYGFALTYDRVLSVLPYVGHFLTAVLFGQLADHARSSSVVSTTTARRLLVYASHFPAGAILFVVGYSGCDPVVPAALYTAAMVMSGAAAAGVHGSAMDLSPNYAGTVFGLSQTLGTAGGLVGSYVVTEALHGSLPGSWRLVFGLAAFILAGTAMAFLGFGSGSVQPWNSGAPPEPSPNEIVVDDTAPVVEVTPPEDSFEMEPQPGPSSAPDGVFESFIESAHDDLDSEAEDSAPVLPVNSSNRLSPCTPPRSPLSSTKTSIPPAPVSPSPEKSSVSLPVSPCGSPQSPLKQKKSHSIPSEPTTSSDVKKDTT